MADDDGKVDKFGDVILAQQGIFGADQGGLEPTLEKHDSVRHVIAQQGLILELYCPGCGVPSQLVVEYPELIAMRYGVNPARAFAQHPRVLQNPLHWRFVEQEQAWRPDLKCPHCQFNICLRISPGETERHLANGRRRGFIDPQFEQQVSQIASAVAGGGHPRMR